jgi:hypothetical protein
MVRRCKASKDALQQMIWKLESYQADQNLNFHRKSVVDK